jgi:hypothetical protein
MLFELLFWTFVYRMGWVNWVEMGISVSVLRIYCRTLYLSPSFYFLDCLLYLLG